MIRFPERRAGWQVLPEPDEWRVCEEDISKDDEETAACEDAPTQPAPANSKLL